MTTTSIAPCGGYLKIDSPLGGTRPFSCHSRRYPFKARGSQIAPRPSATICDYLRRRAIKGQHMPKPFMAPRASFSKSEFETPPIRSAQKLAQKETMRQVSALVLIISWSFGANHDTCPNFPQTVWVAYMELMSINDSLLPLSCPIVHITYVVFNIRITSTMNTSISPTNIVSWGACALRCVCASPCIWAATGLCICPSPCFGVPVT